GACERLEAAVSAQPDDEAGDLGARELVERHARLAGDGAREQRLAGSGRADEQDALGHVRAHRAEGGRLSEEVDDLAQLLGGALRPGDVVERRLGRAIAAVPDLAVAALAAEL